jgi:tetratricopeptide (TPR) repeat protein
MKKLLVTLLLVTAAFAMAQDQPAAGQQPAPQKKVIQDPAEYNAYVAAVQTQDIAARETALEAFLQSYPKSVMKEDTLETLLKLYQQTGPVPKFQDAANRLLQVNPNNVTGLALISFVNRALFVANPTGPDAQKLISEAGELANRGLQLLPTAQKPEGLADADWAKMKDAFKGIFLASAGHAAFVANDYPKAQTTLKAAVEGNPSDVNLVYLLARSYLDPKPPVVDGLFWIARAAALAPAPSKDNLVKYAKNKYVRYHGDAEGFDQLLADAGNKVTIPAGFTVAPAPSPAEQAADMLKKNPPEKLSFGEWEFIMTSGNQQGTDQVWNTIKGKSVKMQGWIIEATPKLVKLAGTPDANDEKRADIELTLTAALTAKQSPKPGTLVTFQGVPDSFVPNPFVMKMTDGSLVLPEAPKATKPSATAPHRPATKKQ